MRVQWKGEDIGEWNGKPRLAESRRIKAELGMLPGEFLDALKLNDPDAVCMLIAMLKTRMDPSSPMYLEDIDGDPDELQVTLSDAERAALKGQRDALVDAVGKDAADLILGSPSTSDSETSTERSSNTPPPSGSDSD